MDAAGRGDRVTYSLTTDKTWSRILDDLDETLRKWPAQLVRVECQLQANRTSRKQQTPAERRVSITWRRRGKERTLAMDTQGRAVDNLLVLQLVLEALRLNEKRGISEAVAEVYRQEFPALPAPREAPAPTSVSGPYAVLHLQPGAPIEVCEAAYRALARRYHPDAGGDSDEQMTALNAAIAAIRKEKGG